MPSPHLANLCRLTDSLSRAAKLEEVYDGALDTLQLALGVSRASILLFDEKDFMGFVAWRGLSDTYRAAVNGHTPWKPDTPNPRPIVVFDVTADESLVSYAPVFAAEGIRALAFFPLVYRDRVIGKFMLYWAEPHAPIEEEIDLAQTIAAQIAFGVARVRVEQELERERERLNAIVVNVPGVVWEAMEDGDERVVTYISPQIEALLGYSPEEWYRDPQFWRRVVVTPDINVVEQLRREGPPIVRYQMKARDGRLIWAEARASYRNENGKRLVRGVTIDVTAQCDAERHEHFLSEASALLTSSFDYDSTLRKIVQLAVPEIATWCAIDVSDEVGDLHRVAEAGTPSTKCLQVPLTAGGRTLGLLSLASSDSELATELARRIGYTVSNARLYREAQEANRAKDEFLATLSHELRTPSPRRSAGPRCCGSAISRRKTCASPWRRSSGASRRRRN